MHDLPNINSLLLQQPDNTQLFANKPGEHKPRILLLYGSLRQRSFSRLVTEEATRLLQAMGADTRIFNPAGLPLPDSEDVSHPKVAELRDLVA